MMIGMKTICTRFLLLFATCSLLHADTVFMKDGTQIEGEVQFQNDQLVKIRIQISKGISETKTLDRKLIEKVVQTAPDDSAFIEMQKLVPTKSLLTANDYRGMLAKGPDSFLRLYPGSKHLEDAKLIKETLTIELERVQQGEVKLGERWFTQEEQIEFEKSFDAEVHFFRMKDHLSKKLLVDLIAGMREFEILEKQFFETPAFAKAIPLAQETVPAFGRRLQELRRDADAKNRQWERAKLALGSGPRKEVEDQRKREMDQLADSIKQQRDAGINWVQVDDRDSEGLDEYIEFAVEELERIKLYSPENALRKSILLTECDKAFVSESYDKAILKLEEAEAISVWTNPNDKRTKRKKADESYSKFLANQLKSKKTKLAKLAKAKEVEERAKKQEEEKARKAEEKKADELDALVASRKKVSAAKPEEDTKSSAKAKKKPTKTVKKAKPRAPRPPPKKKIPPSVFIFAGVGLLVVVILVLKALGIGGKDEE